MIALNKTRSNVVLRLTDIGRGVVMVIMIVVMVIMDKVVMVIMDKGRGVVILDKSKY